MRQIVIAGLFVLAVSCTSGGGTETDNPATLEDFVSSECKTRALDPGQQAIVLSSDAEGLQCVEWLKNGDGTLLVRLLNFPEACGEDYQGTAATGADGTLSLTVQKASCDVLRCGLCVFDFEYTLAGVSTSSPLSIHLGSAICASEPTTFSDEVTLPVDEQGEGVVCRYLERSPLEQYGRGRGTCGQRNLPCGKCDGTDDTSCASGLVCTELASNDSRCLQPCTKDADCAGGLTTCLDGLCRASASW